MKATHLGTCQACGRLHKLPGGVLAKHGYTVRDHWFQGTCMGTGRLPYEVSTDLIQDTIEWASAHADTIEKQVRELSSDAGIADHCAARTTWRHVYHPELSNRSRGAVHVWELVTVEPRGVGGALGVRLKSGELERNIHADPTQFILDGLARYAGHLRHIVRKDREYALNQEWRIRDWKAAPLTPISQ